MKIRRMMAMLLALMLTLSLFACASAEAVAPAYTIEAREVSLNADTKTMAVMGVESRLYALYSAEGTPLTEEKYIHMSAVEDMYEVAVEGGVNVLGMMDAEGNILVPMEYGDVKHISSKWQLGVKLTSATADNYDYKSFSNSGEFYLIEAYDVYYCGTKVGSLGRTDYYNAYAYGDYLYVSNKERNYTYYNKDFVASGYIGNNSSSEYEEKRDGIWHRGSGQQAFVADCTLTSEEVELDINEVEGRMVDLQGNILFAVDAKYTYMTEFKGDYARVSMNDKDGLIDRTGREVIPCEYDDLSYGDTFFEGGYQIAIKDGKVGFLNANGEVTCDFKYSESAVKSTYKMPLTHLLDLDGSAIVLSAAVGELPNRYAEVRITNNNGCPVFAAVNFDKQAAIINLYGEELVSFGSTYDSTYDFQISADGTMVVGYAGDRMYNVYKFTESDLYGAAASEENVSEEPAANVAQGALIDSASKPADQTAQEESAADDGSWKCSNGHANTGKFCSECGEARPADVLKCSKCGYQPEEGTAPKFCSECGNAF